MENILEKSFINSQLGINFNSYIDKECNIWFKAKEVAQILGYKNTEKAIKSHVSENHKRKILFSNQHETHGCSMTYFLDEAGFYELVFKSRLPAAKIFREWVFTIVLPSIRKFGYFNMFKSKIKRRVIIDGEKFYKHEVFDSYAAKKDGVVINLRNKRNIKMSKNNSGYLYFKIYNKKLKNYKAFFQHRFVYEVFKGKIPHHLEIDHINNLKTDNRIKNLQLLTHKKNMQKSHNKPIISISIETGKKKIFDSIKKASNELDIDSSNISKVCRKIYKTATSKKDGCKYTFRYVD